MWKIFSFELSSRVEEKRENSSEVKLNGTKLLHFFLDVVNENNFCVDEPGILLTQLWCVWYFYRELNRAEQSQVVFLFSQRSNLICKRLKVESVRNFRKGIKYSKVTTQEAQTEFRWITSKARGFEEHYRSVTLVLNEHIFLVAK